MSCGPAPGSTAASAPLGTPVVTLDGSPVSDHARYLDGLPSTASDTSREAPVWKHPDTVVASGMLTPFWLCAPRRPAPASAARRTTLACRRVAESRGPRPRTPARSHLAMDGRRTRGCVDSCRAASRRRCSTPSTSQLRWRTIASSTRSSTRRRRGRLRARRRRSCSRCTSSPTSSASPKTSAGPCSRSTDTIAAGCSIQRAASASTERLAVERSLLRVPRAAQRRKRTAQVDDIGRRWCRRRSSTTTATPTRLTEHELDLFFFLLAAAGSRRPATPSRTVRSPSSSTRAAAQRRRSRAIYDRRSRTIRGPESLAHCRRHGGREVGWSPWTYPRVGTSSRSGTVASRDPRPRSRPGRCPSSTVAERPVTLGGGGSRRRPAAVSCADPPRAGASRATVTGAPDRARPVASTVVCSTRRVPAPHAERTRRPRSRQVRRSASTRERALEAAGWTAARPRVCAISGSPGPKFSAGIPRAANRATSVHPSFGRTAGREAAHELGHQRVR